MLYGIRSQRRARAVAFGVLLGACAGSFGCTSSAAHAIADADASDGGASHPDGGSRGADPDAGELAIAPGCVARVILDGRATDICGSAGISSQALALGSSPFDHGVVLQYWPDDFEVGTIVTGCGATSAAFVDMHLTWPESSMPSVYQTAGDCAPGVDIVATVHISTHDRDARRIAGSIDGTLVEVATRTPHVVAVRFDASY